MRKPGSGLPRALYPLFGITFIDMLGLTILVPLLPFFVKRFGAPPQALGLMLTTTAVCAAISGPLWGAASDRIGRKPVLMISQAFAFAGFLLLALSGNLFWAFVSRVVQGLGGGNLGVADSYIADVTTEEQRPKAYGYSAAVFGAGFVVGPVTSGLLVHFGFVVPFVAAAVLELVNMFLTFRFLPERPKQRAPDAREHRKELLEALRSPAILSLLARYFCFIFAFTYFFTNFGLYLDRVLRVGPSAASLLLAIAGVVGALVTIFGVNILTQRFGSQRVSTMSFAVGFVAFTMLFFVNDLPLFVATIVVWAVSGALLRPTLDTLLSQAAPERERGSILGVADALTSVAMIASPALGSYVVATAPRLTGIVPAAVVAAGFALGLTARGRP